MTSFTLLLGKKLFSPLKNLPAIFTNSKQSKTPFGRNSVTYGTPCHARGHFVFLLSPCYVEDTMPHQWSFSDLPWVLRIWESVFYSPAFFTLHSLLLASRPSWGRQFNLNISRVSCWYLRNIAPAWLFVWITTIHKKVYSGSIMAAWSRE